MTHLFVNAEVCVNTLMISSLCALTKCLRTNLVLDDCPRDIEILPEHRNYLGFAWHCDGRTKYFVFNILPFGLSTAGHIFTKLLRGPVRYLRSQGVNIITFLDDGIAGGNSYDVAQSTSHSV